MDVVGHPVAQSFVVVHRDLEKLGEVVRPKPPGARQTSQHTLFRPVLEQCSYFPGRLPWEIECPGEAFTYERSRKAVGQSHKLLLLGWLRDIRNGGDRLDQHVRHGYRIEIRRRLALIADFVDSFRVRGRRVEDTLRDAHDVSA